MPDLSDNPVSYIFDWLCEIGFTDSDRPHNYANLTAWAEHIGLRLSAFELSTMVSLSLLYLISLRKYNDEKDNSMQPYIDESEIVERRDQVADSLRQQMTGLIKSRGGNG